MLQKYTPAYWEAKTAVMLSNGEDSTIKDLHEELTKLVNEKTEVKIDNINIL